MSYGQSCPFFSNLFLNFVYHPPIVSFLSFAETIGFLPVCTNDTWYKAKNYSPKDCTKCCRVSFGLIIKMSWSNKWKANGIKSLLQCPIYAAV